MSEKQLSGGCACGAVRYETSAEPVIVAHCHCRDCQRASGAAMSTIFAVPRAQFRHKGPTSTYATTGDSGNPVVRHFLALTWALTKPHKTVRTSLGTAPLRTSRAGDPFSG